MHLDGMRAVREAVRALAPDECVVLEAVGAGGAVALDAAMVALLGGGSSLATLTSVANLLENSRRAARGATPAAATAVSTVSTVGREEPTAPTELLRTRTAAALASVGSGEERAEGEAEGGGQGGEGGGDGVALRWLRGAARALGKTGPKADAAAFAAVADAREWLWAALQAFCSRQGGDDGAGARAARVAVLELLSELSGGSGGGATTVAATAAAAAAGGVVRWEGWAPPTDHAFRAGLLLCRSVAAVGALGPSAHLTAADVADADAASALFARLLAAAVTTTSDESSSSKLDALAALLALWEVEASWAHVDSSESSESAAVGDQAEPVVVSRLHGCWRALFERMLRGSSEGTRAAEAVLSVLVRAEEGRALLTAADAIRLMDVPGLPPAVTVKIGLLVPTDASRAEAVRRLVAAWEGNDDHGHHGGDGTPLAADVELTALLLAVRRFGAAATATAAAQRGACAALAHAAATGALGAVAVAAAASELTTARAYGLAGALVMQYRRVPVALATTDASLVMLERFLRVRPHAFPQKKKGRAAGVCEQVSGAAWRVQLVAPHGWGNPAGRVDTARQPCTAKGCSVSLSVLQSLSPCRGLLCGEL